MSSHKNYIEIIYNEQKSVPVNLYFEYHYSSIIIIYIKNVCNTV